MRLFQGDPVWTPYNRAPEVLSCSPEPTVLTYQVDQFRERQEYINSLVSENTEMKIAGETIEEAAAKRPKAEVAAQ